MPTIEIRSLTKRFGSVDAVSDLTFDVPPGRVTGFLGPNGAGKTTTLRVLLGLIRPTSGSATFEGRTYEQLDDPSRRVGAVLEDTGFHPGRSGRDHLRVLAATSGVPAARVDETLELVGLAGPAAKQRVKGYSLGMRQRLAIASALLGDPEVLVLDEPTNGLDPAGVRWLRSLMRSAAGQGKAVLVSSHLLAEVAQTVDEAVVIAGGRLRASGPIGTLMARAEGSVTRVRSVDDARLAAALEGERITVERDGDALLVRGASPELVGRAAFAAGVAVTGLGSEGQSLEDVFLQLVEEPRSGKSPDPVYEGIGDDPAAAR